MTLDSTWAVVTTYCPQYEAVKAIGALAGQVRTVVVVDDGSGVDADRVLAAAEALGALVIRMPENGGIAAALNRGIAAALDGGADAVVTFDQDSVVGDGYIAALVATFEAARSRGRTLGPVVPEYFSDVRQVHHADDDGTLVARHVIQSGMLLDRALLTAVGQMRADLFIDLVDKEFELRCASAGRAPIAAPGLILAHSLGRRYEQHLFGRSVRFPGIPQVVTLSTPFRYYYRVRNRRAVNKDFWRKHFVWIARDTLVETLHFANAWALARPRRDLWKIYRAGWRDARLGRMGRMPEDIAATAATINWAAPPVR